MTNHYEAIATLVYGYAEFLDGGDFERLADLFAHATLHSNRSTDVRRGREQALAMYRNTVALYDGVPSTKHVITNLAVDVGADGASAAARSYFTVLQARPQLPLQIIIAGRYHDCFVHADGSWRFADRLILVDLVGDLRFHLKHNPME